MTADTADTFNGIDDPNVDITTRKMVISPAPNCISFIQFERTNEILIVSARNAFYELDESDSNYITNYSISERNQSEPNIF